LNVFKIFRSAARLFAADHKVSAMRSTKGEQTRAAIAEAALRMFREQGYEATTMRAIAKEVGVATGNAYYYFDSKEELIQEY
jgi:AcrR family transcriptional regulator